MAITIASINLSGGDTVITINYNGNLISDPAGAGLTVGTMIYTAVYGSPGLPIASISGANITLTGNWLPAMPIPGSVIGIGDPPNTIRVVSYSFSGNTTLEFNLDGQPLAVSYPVGSTVIINGEGHTVISVSVGTGGGGRDEYVVSGGWGIDLSNLVALIDPPEPGGGGGGGGKPSFAGGGRVPEVDLLPAKEARVPEADLLPIKEQRVPEADLVPAGRDKNGLKN